jgi:hypothetical protein
LKVIELNSLISNLVDDNEHGLNEVANNIFRDLEDAGFTSVKKDSYFSQIKNKS